MLLKRYGAASPYPFEAPGVRYYYFARNAVWTLTRILGLDKGEVLVPAYHHGVELEALIDAGATPRFFRVNWKMQVDPDDVKKLITPKTKAIYLIHYAGFPGPAKELKEIAEAHGLPLIEDCALSLLSKDGERPLGSIGDASIFCLYKTLPVPNGGALVMNGDRPKGIPAPPEPPMASTLSHLASALLMNLELRGGAAGRMLRQSVRAVGRTAVNGAGVERVA
ncbi:MAG: DegT/DnrJ/EryC1/StrS family aminotransferase, partial [Myxococcales bacterium]